MPEVVTVQDEGAISIQETDVQVVTSGLAQLTATQLAAHRHTGADGSLVVPETSVTALVADLAARLTGVTQGVGVSVTGGAPSPTIANTGVLSFNGRAGAVALAAGDVTGVLGAASLPESTITNLVTDLAAKAADSAVVHLTGTEVITGLKTHQSATASTVGMIIQAAASQSADMLDLVSSTSVLLTSFDSIGNLHLWGTSASQVELATRVTGDTNDRFQVSADGKLSWGPGNAVADFTLTRTNANYLTFQAVAAASEYLVLSDTIGTQRVIMGMGNGTLIQNITFPANIGTQIKGATSQSANLQEWQRSDAVVLASVSSVGTITAPYLRGAVNQAFFDFTGTTLKATVALASQVPLTVQGAASQSGDLFQVQNSSSSVLAKIDSSGDLLLGVASLGSLGAYATSLLLEANGAIRADRVGTPSQYIELAGGDASGVWLHSYGGSGKVLRLACEVSGGSGGISFQQGVTGAVAEVGRFDGLGHLNVGGFQVTGTNTLLSVGTYQAANNLATAQITSQSATSNALVVQGYTSQSGDLTEWQNSSATVLARVGASGAYTSYGVTNSFLNLAVPTSPTASAPQAGGALTVATPYYWVVTAVNAAGETIKSAEVTQTPTSGNQTVTVSWTAVTGATSYKLYRSTVSGTYTTPALVATITAPTVSYADTGAGLSAGAPSTATVGTKLVLQRWSGQSGNVLETQDQTGALTAMLALDGSLYTRFVGVGGTGAPSSALYLTAALSVTPNATGQPGQVIRGLASQSADFLQFQNSSSTVLASITAAGEHLTVGALTSTLAIRAKVTGDTNDRFTIGANGDLNWGPGSGATDVALSRAGVSQLNVPRLTRSGVGSIFDTGASQNSSYSQFAAANASFIPLTVKGFTSQSADLQQWLSSTGSILTLVAAAGDLKLNAVGTGLYVKEGTNATMGVATLVAGTVTVATTKVTASSRIHLTSQADGGTVGFQRVSGRTPGTSFTITSSNAADTSQVGWFIVEPA